MVNTVLPVPQTGRVLRKPQHTFNLKYRPYEIQPFMIAPVLPGETMKNALIQARVVTDPVKNPLVGWWCEFYLFYVKHRDMPNSAAWQQMVLTLGYDVSARRTTAAKAEHYINVGGIDWVDECLKAVVSNYFRDEGEPHLIAGTNARSMPVAKLNTEGWMDSLTTDTAMPDGTAPPAGATPEQIDALMAQYELMRAYKLTNMTYEEWLKTYGVRPQLAEKPNRPELLRYVRDWSYPANTINAATGAPSSALSWSIAERADKDRFFAEPGFLFGVACCRPKVYYGQQVAYAASMMDDAMTWLPAVMRSEPYTSLKKLAADKGPLAGFQGAGTDPYWVDVRDLFLYGDQFVNYAMAAADGIKVGLPTATTERKYAPNADVTALFKTAGSEWIKCDGIASLHILGTQVDQT